jgi:hypothetical protein
VRDGVRICHDVANGEVQLLRRKMSDLAPCFGIFGRDANRLKCRESGLQESPCIGLKCGASEVTDS